MSHGYEWKDRLVEGEHVNLLWTGGWDSTFHLLQLLLIHRTHITPYYLIDDERPSTGIELRTIQRIKEHLFRSYPHTQDLLHPTKYFAVADITPDREITEAFQSIVKRKFMGSQYEWLARFCKQESINDMHICIERTERNQGAWAILKPFVIKCDADPLGAFRYDRAFEAQEEYTIFRYFCFPTLDISKMEMAALGKENGWDKLMELTWFCHKPTKHMKPCGRCNPCRYTIEEGLGWRIPASSHRRAFLERNIVVPAKLSAKRTLEQLGLLEYIKKNTCWARRRW